MTETLKQGLAQGEAYLVFSPENRLYLTGFESSDGWLLIGSKTVFLTDSRYIEAAQAQAKGCDEVTLLTSLSTQLPALVSEQEIKEIYIEADRLSVYEFERLAAILPGVKITAGSRLTEAIDVLRSIKTPAEVKNIIAAQKIAEAAFDYILGFIKPGLTERQVQLELDYKMLSLGAQALSFDTVAVSGAKSSMPHGVPGNKIIENGDFLTLDFGAVVNGYHSDMTRTVAVGSANEKMRSVYGIVLEAQKAALEVLRPGFSCFEADKTARDIIVNAGYGENFGHSTGHGVGIEIHEKPNLSTKAGEKMLVPGNVVTIEPGIYIPGEFGVRIEDMALITGDGYRNLTSSPKELIII